MQTQNIVVALLIGSLSTFTWGAKSTGTVRPLGDSALTQFVRLVLDTNPRIQAVRSALNSSQALRSAAAQPLYNPTFEFEAENADANTRTLGVSQTVDWNGKRSARTAIASADYQAAEAEYLLARRTATIELLSGLAAYQTDLERGTLATERTRIMQDFASLAKQRFDAKDISQIEFNLANLTFADARMERATIAASLSEARQQVNNLTSSDVTTQWPTLDAKLPALPIQKNPHHLLMGLPEVQLAQHQVDSANRIVALRKREKRLDPTISLTGGKEGGERLISLNLSIPLPVRNPFNHEVEAAYEQYQQAQKIADDLLQRAYSRLVNASERYEIAQSAWLDWQQFGQISLQQQCDQLRLLWRSGEISTTDFLVQIGQTIDSQDRALELRKMLWCAWFEWLAASGQLERWLGIKNSTHSIGDNSHR